ncbi:hypothetical protein SLA2020_167770 [Shorea laevis]
MLFGMLFKAKIRNSNSKVLNRIKSLHQHCSWLLVLSQKRYVSPSDAKNLSPICKRSIGSAFYQQEVRGRWLQASYSLETQGLGHQSRTNCLKRHWPCMTRTPQSGGRMLPRLWVGKQQRKSRGTTKSLLKTSSILRPAAFPSPTTSPLIAASMVIKKKG